MKFPNPRVHSFHDSIKVTLPQPTLDQLGLSRTLLRDQVSFTAKSEPATLYINSYSAQDNNLSICDYLDKILVRDKNQIKHIVSKQYISANPRLELTLVFDE